MDTGRLSSREDRWKLDTCDANCRQRICRFAADRGKAFPSSRPEIARKRGQDMPESLYRDEIILAITKFASTKRESTTTPRSLRARRETKIVLSLLTARDIPGSSNPAKQNIPAIGQKLATVTRKQNTIIQNHIWTLFGLMASNCASNTNMEILQKFQNKYLGIIVNAPWYVTNDTLHHDLNVPTLDTRLKDSARDTPIGRRNIPTYSRKHAD